MKITREGVLHVAHLARLELDEAAIDRFAGQIAEILEYIDKLNQVDTTGIKPTSHAVLLSSEFREDNEIEHLDRKVALSNAPQEEDGNFVVPKVIG